MIKLSLKSEFEKVKEKNIPNLSHAEINQLNISEPSLTYYNAYYRHGDYLKRLSVNRKCICVHITDILNTDKIADSDFMPEKLVLDILLRKSSIPDASMPFECKYILDYCAKHPGSWFFNDNAHTRYSEYDWDEEYLDRLLINNFYFEPFCLFHIHDVSEYLYNKISYLKSIKRVLYSQKERQKDFLLDKFEFKNLNISELLEKYTFESGRINRLKLFDDIINLRISKNSLKTFCNIPEIQKKFKKSHLEGVIKNKDIIQESKAYSIEYLRWYMSRLINIRVSYDLLMHLYAISLFIRDKGNLDEDEN